jgi:hypothetical protein
MAALTLDADTRRRVIDWLARTLKAFHEAEQRKGGGYEAISWRGQLGGFRYALGIVFDQVTTSEILEAVRQQTKLGFPHIGPVMDSGDIQGIDSEAQPGL